MHKVLQKTKFVPLFLFLILIVTAGCSSEKQSDLPKKTNCHPSYSGCLNPDVSDYDCKGGSGNGPLYTGKVRVIGPDVFNLDRDGDGWGCE